MKVKFIGENDAGSVTFRGCEFPCGESVEVKCETDSETEKLKAMLRGHPEFEILGDEGAGNAELESAKKEADDLGVKYPANIKLETLLAKIEKAKAE